MKSLYDLCIFRATTICCLSPLNCLRYFIPGTEFVLKGKRNLVALLFILMLHHTKKNVLTLLVKFFCSGKCASQVLVCPSFHLHWVQHFFKSQVSTTDVKILRLWIPFILYQNPTIFPYLTSRSEHSYENMGMEFYHSDCGTGDAEKRNLSSPTRSLLTSPDAIPLSHKQFQPITSTTPIWVVTRHQYGISALVSQTSFGGETSGGVARCRLFSQTM